MNVTAHSERDTVNEQRCKSAAAKRTASQGKAKTVDAPAATVTMGKSKPLAGKIKLQLAAGLGGSNLAVSAPPWAPRVRRTRSAVDDQNTAASTSKRTKVDGAPPPMAGHLTNEQVACFAGMPTICIQGRMTVVTFELLIDAMPL